MIILVACGCATGANRAATVHSGRSVDAAVILARQDCEAGSSHYGKTLTIVCVGEKDWVVYTEKGYFDCTPGAEQYFHFVRGMEAASVEEYREQYHVPGLREIFMRAVK